MEAYTLAAIRVNKGLTVEAMADLIGVSVDRWRRVESGETKMLATELINFHKVTGVPYEYINVPQAD